MELMLVKLSILFSKLLVIQKLSFLPVTVVWLQWKFYNFRLAVHTYCMWVPTRNALFESQLTLFYSKNFKLIWCLGSFDLQIGLNVLKYALFWSYCTYALPFKNLPWTLQIFFVVSQKFFFFLEFFCLRYMLPRF